MSRVKSAVIAFQSRTAEWNRKRTEEDGIAELERERIRAVLLNTTNIQADITGKPRPFASSRPVPQRLSD